MNSIAHMQLEPRQLDRLAAQRNLYSKAKRVQSWQVVLSVPCVIAWSFIVMVHPTLRSYAALWGIVITLLDMVVLDRWQKNLKQKAASIQERFDCDVLDLPWSELKVRQPDAELIAEQSSRYRRTDPEYKALRDWYPPAVERLPIHLGRIVCQRSSSWWDARLRRRYSVWVLIALGAFSILIVTLSLLQGATLENLILTGITPLMPAITLAMKQYFEHNDAALRADALKDYSEKLWHNALAGGPVAEEISFASRQLQDEIFEHRRRNPLIFDWIYRSLQREDEKLMNKGAEALVQEALVSRGYSASG